ncbi:hypothetical protein JCM5350_003423 [Sporobolomyces pararoseus]
MSTKQQTIICGVNCACAPTQPATTTISKSSANCSAHEGCAYAKEGKCGCENGVCKASEAKKGCEKGKNGECSCAAGTCEAAESARKSCSKNGECGCPPGTCKAAGYTS